MGIIGSAIGAGLGQGMAIFGGQLMQNEALREREANARADRWALEAEKMAERRRELQDKLAAKAAEPLSVDQVTAKFLEGELAKVPEPDQAAYTKELMGPLPEGEDESARKLVDREGYSKASRAARDEKIGIINRVKDPSAMKSLREADYQAVVNDWMKEAANEPDPKKREAKIALLNQLTIAAEGKHMYGQGGEGQTLNVATGTVKSTPVSEANARQSEAAAAASRANAAESAASARLSDRTDFRGQSGSKNDPTSGKNAERAVDAAREELLVVLGGKKEDIAGSLRALKSRASSSNESTRKEAEEKLKEVEPLLAKYRNALARQHELLPPEKNPAPRLSDDDRKKALADAKRALDGKLLSREEVLRRLKAAGIDPKGL